MIDVAGAHLDHEQTIQTQGHAGGFGQSRRQGGEEALVQGRDRQAQVATLDLIFSAVM